MLLILLFDMRQLPRLYHPIILFLKYYYYIIICMFFKFLIHLEKIHTRIVIKIFKPTYSLLSLPRFESCFLPH